MKIPFSFPTFFCLCAMALLFSTTASGYDALLVGASGEDVRDITDAGAFSVLPNDDGSGLKPENASLWTQDVLEDGTESGDSFADAVESGDFNGDGHADVAIGIPREDWESYDGLETIEDAGAVNIIYGTVNGLTTEAHQFWTQRDIDGAAAEKGDQF